MLWKQYCVYRTCVDYVIAQLLSTFLQYHNGFPKCKLNLEIGITPATLRPWSPFKKQYSNFSLQFEQLTFYRRSNKFLQEWNLRCGSFGWVDRPQPQCHKCLQCAPARPTKVALVRQMMQPQITVVSASNPRQFWDVSSRLTLCQTERRDTFVKTLDIPTVDLSGSWWCILNGSGGLAIACEYGVVFFTLPDPAQQHIKQTPSPQPCMHQLQFIWFKHVNIQF